MDWICKYCGGDTSNVEYDYLDGYNHLSCTLTFYSKKMKTKIYLENPDKINSLNYCLNGDSVEINYEGNVFKRDEVTNEYYVMYKFVARKNRSSIIDTNFVLHNYLDSSNKVMLNIQRYGSSQSKFLDVSIVKDKNKFLNTLIDLVENT